MTDADDRTPVSNQVKVNDPLPTSDCQHVALPSNATAFDDITPEKYARILAELERLRVKVSRLELQPQSALPTPVVLEEAVDHAAENALLRAENEQLLVENARLQTVAASLRHFDSRARCEPGAVIVFPLLDGQRDVQVTVISCATRGGQSVTFKASAAFRGRRALIALKCISTSPGQQSLVWREVNVWRSAVHPSLQRLLGVLREDYENAGEHILASPWMEDGNMLQFLRQRPDVSRLTLVTEVADAVEHLHSTLGIVHGDIKCENVLINKRGHAILTDFGLSTFIRKDEEEATTATGLRGMFTVDFCAPELVHDEVSDGKRNRSKTTQTDVYAFGMLVLQAFTLRRPWADVQNKLQLVISISEGAVPLRPDLQSAAVGYGFDDDMWRLCLMCWNYFPQNRPSMASVARCLMHTQASPQPHDTDAHNPYEGLCCDAVVPHVTVQTSYDAEFHAFLAWLPRNSASSPVTLASEPCEFIIRLATVIDFGRACGELMYGCMSLTRTQGLPFVHVQQEYARENRFIHRVAFRNYKCRVHALWFQLDLYKCHADPAVFAYADDQTTMASAATLMRPKTCQTS